MTNPNVEGLGDERVVAKVSPDAGLRVTIRLSYDESEAAERLAGERGLLLPAFVRQLVLDAIGEPAGAARRQGER